MERKTLELKTPFTYYGGKQKIAKKILPFIPEHQIYCEPFAGGAAIFFAKGRPKDRATFDYVEVLNDIDKAIVNFFRVLREKPTEFIRLIEATPYSREEFNKAKALKTTDELEFARATFIMYQMSFGSEGKTWGISRSGTNNAGLAWSKKPAILEAVCNRLKGVFIESKEALDCIRTWDNPKTFFYCDPPYLGTHHKWKYTEEDFIALVELAERSKGKFMVSSYPSVDKFFSEAGWRKQSFEAKMYIHAKSKKSKKREECIWMNY